MSLDTSLNRRSLLGAIAAGTFVLPAIAAPISLTGPVVDAATFGLIPGGRGDQTDTLIEAARVTARRGEILNLQPGHYLISNARLPDGARISGFGAVLNPVPGNAVIDTRDLDRLALDGLTIRGGAGSLGDANALVNFANVDQVQISNCTIDASAETGIGLNGCGGVLSGNTITNCHSTGIFALDCRALDIEGNTVSTCLDNGILVWQSAKRHDGARVTGNRIAKIGAISGGTGQYGNGVNIYRAGSVLVSDNVIEDCAYTAVRVNGADNCQIIGNSCARLGEVALYVEFAFQGAIVANNIVDQAALGISVTNYGNAGGRLAVVSGNLVRNLFTPAYGEERGVGISVEADVAVSGNTVENAAIMGIMVGWYDAMRDCSITGNVVRASPTGIGVTVSIGAGHAVITGNRIAGADKGAVIGLNGMEPVTGDLTKPGAKIDPRLTVSNNSAG